MRWQNYCYTADLSHGTSFLMRVLFLVQDPSQDPSLHFIVMSPYSPPICDRSSLSSLTLTLLKRTGQ